MKNFLIFFGLLLFTTLQTFAYHFSAVSPSGHTLYYNIISSENKTVSVTSEKEGNDKYEEAPEGDIIIPSTVIYEEEEYKVIKIESSIFWNCNKITSVVVEEGVQSIDWQVFQGCTRLQTVVFPNSLTNMDDNIFSGCKKLTNVTLSNQLTKIPSGTFWECESLQSIEIPSTVTSIETSAFYLCSALKSIELPEGLTKIKEDAFGSCYSLSSLTLPNTLTHIGNNAIESNLIYSISIPATIVDLADRALGLCSNLSQIYLNATTPPTLGENAFPSSATIYVPCEAIDAYKTHEDWLPYKSYLTTASHKVFVNSSNPEYGYITTEMTNSCDDEFTAIITAFSEDEDNYQFGGWNDGNKDNPRTITVTKDTSFTATFGKKPKILNLETENPICTSATGSASFDVTNGVAPYTILWNDGNTDNPRSEMTPGKYYFVATDAEGYTSDTTYVTLYPNEDNMPQISLNPTNPICETENGAIEATVSGGMEPYIYNWSKANTKETSIFNFESEISNDKMYIFEFDVNNSQNYTVKNISIENSGAAGSDHSVHVQQNLNNNYASQLNLNTEDLLSEQEITESYGLSFYHKGSSTNFYIRSEGGWSAAYDIPYHSEWTLVSISWNEMSVAGYKFDHFAWIGYDNPDLWLDELSILSYDNSVSLSSEKSIQNLAAGQYMFSVTDSYGCKTTENHILQKNYSNIPQPRVEYSDPVCETPNGIITANATGGTEPYVYKWTKSVFTEFAHADFENGEQTLDMQIYPDRNDSFIYTEKTLNATKGGANNTEQAIHVQVTIEPKNAFAIYYNMEEMDLSNTYGLSFYHKGSSVHFAGYSTKTNQLTSLYTIPYNGDWSFIQLTWAELGFTGSDLEEIPFFLWESLLSNEGEYDFWLDEIAILSYDSEQELSTLQTIDELSAGLYNLKVTDAHGCAASQSVELTKDESNKPVITKSFTNAICGHDVGEISISYENGNGELQYAWNDGSTELQRENLAPGIYIFTISDEYGCTASDVTEIKAESFKYQPELALVTVSQQSPANLVIWQKEETDAIDFYSIYRETTSANVYEKIEDVPFNQTSIFVDENTDSQTKAYRYKISATDYCGNESPQSPNHKTINATASLGVGGVVNLIWDGYEGFDFSTYSIYRITKDGTTEIDKVPSTNWTYVDKNVPQNTLSYFVAVELPVVIDVNNPFIKAESGPFSLAMSNIAEIENQGTPIALVDENMVNVYSAHKAIVVENASENQITICNALGQTIARAKGENEIQKSFDVESGAYIVIVGNKAVKVVVE